jgi:hypothetical protein
MRSAIEIVLIVQFFWGLDAKNYRNRQ